MATQVPTKGRRPRQGGQAPGDPDDRLLHQFLGQFPVAGKNVGEAKSPRAVTQVKSLQLVTSRWIAHRILGSLKLRPDLLSTTKTPCWLQRFRRIAIVRTPRACRSRSTPGWP